MMKKKMWIVLGIVLAMIVIIGTVTNNIDIKMRNWFMKYDLPNEKSVTIEYNGKTIEINTDDDINKISNIITNAKYDSEICNGISTHKIILENEIYNLKEGCQAIQKGDKQATISIEDIETINNIISDKIKREQKIYSKKVDQTTIELSIPNEWSYEEIFQEENSNFEFALKLYKNSSNKSVTLYYYNDPFGVCGTGRRTKKIKLNNGKEATVGYYDNENEWSDISFYELNPNIVFINNDASEYSNEVLEIVKTIDIKTTNSSY